MTRGDVLGYYLKDVNFSYPSKKNALVLDNLNFKINKKLKEILTEEDFNEIETKLKALEVLDDR